MSTTYWYWVGWGVRVVSPERRDLYDLHDRFQFPCQSPGLSFGGADAHDDPLRVYLITDGCQLEDEDCCSHKGYELPSIEDEIRRLELIRLFAEEYKLEVDYSSVGWHFELWAF